MFPLIATLIAVVILVIVIKYTYIHFPYLKTKDVSKISDSLIYIIQSRTHPSRNFFQPKVIVVVVVRWSCASFTL